MQTFRQPALIVASVLFAMACSGCGSDNARVPVSGTVTIDGKPLTYGYVMLVPGNDRPAGGDIGGDGSFTLKSFGKEEGCPRGTHKVAVVAVEALSASTQRWHAPKHYRDPESSGLTVTIDEPTDSLEIKLEWNGGKPFVEGTGATGDVE